MTTIEAEPLWKRVLRENNPTLVGSGGHYHRMIVEPPESHMTGGYGFLNAWDDDWRSAVIFSPYDPTPPESRTSLVHPIPDFGA